MKSRWNELLNAKRLRESSLRPEESTLWNPFDSDYSRVSFSASFRRLQDKAQVFPLENSDFVRTRLTHSIEVSGVGRSIGVRIEDELIKLGNLDKSKKGHIPSILATAGLIHDIGNPPFGHFGEKIIQNFFEKELNLKIKDTDGTERNKYKLPDRQAADLKKFDGNVQSFRIITKLSLSDKEYGMNLTMPTVATILKYPKSSLTGNDKDLGVCFKKFGYFDSDMSAFTTINETLKLDDSRHPLCFILEACDDICYTASDIEDGIAKNVISFSDIKNLLKRKNDKICSELLEKMDDWCNKHLEWPSHEKLVAQKIRIFAQSTMIDATVKEFIGNLDSILNNDFNDEIINSSKARSLREVFSEIGRKCFVDKSVVKRELFGNTVLSYLLRQFTDCIMSDDFKTNNTINNKIYLLFPSLFIDVFEKSPQHDYDKLLLVTDFISGMTDSYAVRLYNEMLGIDLKNC